MINILTIHTSLLSLLLICTLGFSKDFDNEIISARVTTHNLDAEQRRILTRLLGNTGADVVDFTPGRMDHDKPPITAIRRNGDGTFSQEWPSRNVNQEVSTQGGDGFLRRNGLVNGWYYYFHTNPALKREYISHQEFVRAQLQSKREEFELKEIENKEGPGMFWLSPQQNVSLEEFFEFAAAPSTLKGVYLNQNYRTLLTKSENMVNNYVSTKGRRLKSVPVTAHYNNEAKRVIFVINFNFEG